MGKTVKKTVYNKTFYYQKGPKHLASIVIKIAKEKNAKKVLDVGAGSGWLVSKLRSVGIEAYGCDRSLLAIKSNLIVRAEATKLPFKTNSFDLVTSISLIEHLTPSQVNKFLTEIKRVLKPKGFLLLVTPNFGSPLRLIQGKNWHAYLDVTHINFYTPLSLRRLLLKMGFINTKFTLPTPPPEDFDWIIPFFPTKLPKLVRIILNFLITSTPLSILKNSFSILAQNK